MIPSVILVFVVGVLSAYTFFNIGRDCHIEGEASTMGEAWEKEFGPKFSWIVNLSCLLTALGAVLSYSILIGDTFSSLAKFVGMKVRSRWLFLQFKAFCMSLVVAPWFF